MEDHIIETVDQPLTNPLDLETKEFKKGLRRRQNNRKALLDWVRENLVQGTDFMRVYSKKRKEWSKPFLTKAGSEKVLGMLGVQPTFPDFDVKPDTDNILVRCVLVNAEGAEVGFGVGARSISSDYGDLNKASKMALKSAQIDATLRLGGLSEMFTQDEPLPDVDPVPQLLNNEQAEKLKSLIKDNGLDERSFLEYYGIKNINNLQADYYDRAERAILKAAEKKNAAEQ